NRYRLVPLTPRRSNGSSGQLEIMSGGFDAADFLVHSERHGVPQSRTRIIVLGIRDDISLGNEPAGDRIAANCLRTVSCAIRDLPHLRSGVSGLQDSAAGWLEILKEVKSAAWFRCAPKDVRSAMKDAIAD